MVYLMLEYRCYGSVRIRAFKEEMVYTDKFKDPTTLDRSSR